MTNPEFWFDVRGNHDTYTTELEYNSYFDKYSISGKYNRSVMYGFDITTPSSKYLFSTFFSTLPKCSIEPLCIYGSSNHEKCELLNEINNEKADFRIMLSHHPIMFLNPLSPENRSEDLRDVINNNEIDLVLSGHVHDTIGKTLFV